MVNFETYYIDQKMYKKANTKSRHLTGGNGIQS